MTLLAKSRATRSTAGPSSEKKVFGIARDFVFTLKNVVLVIENYFVLDLVADREHNIMVISKILARPRSSSSTGRMLKLLIVPSITASASAVVDVTLSERARRSVSSMIAEVNRCSTLNRRLGF